MMSVSGFRSLRQPSNSWWRRAILDTRRGFSLGLAAALVGGMSGCVQISDVDGEQVYTYDPWVPLTALVVGIAATLVGWLLRHRSVRFGWGLVIVAPLMTALAVPSLWQDRVVVGRDRVHVRTGIWGLTAVHSVPFAQVKEIVICEETSASRYGTHTNQYLVCAKHNGGSWKLPINNTLTQAAAKAILTEAMTHAIPIRDATGGRSGAQRGRRAANNVLGLAGVVAWGRFPDPLPGAYHSP